MVDRQYVNNNDFVSARQVDKPYQKTKADQDILQDDGHFRVLDVSRDGQSRPARAAYFHNSLNGYHAAKLGRFDDLMEFHIYRNNTEVLNMLNTKYVLAEGQSGAVEASTRYTNPNGNAWFVSTVKSVETANDEILALDSLNTKTEAVVLKSVANAFNIKRNYKTDSTASIELISHKPNVLKYQSKNANDGLAVFSELYYYRGWNAYIDGELIPHLRVNYALRALEIPSGNHTIEFKFEPQVVKTGSKIALMSSALVFILLILGGVLQYRKVKVSV